MIEPLNWNHEFPRTDIERNQKINEIIDWINSHSDVSNTEENRQGKDTSKVPSLMSQPAVCECHPKTGQGWVCCEKCQGKVKA